MVDISSMDLDELKKLENAIEGRKKELREKAFTKDDIKYDERILNYIFENFPGTDKDFKWSEKHPNKVSDLGNDVYRRITKSMIILCDMALKNYQPSVWRSGKNQSQIARQSTIIPSDLSSEYKSMWSDIWDVYMKYAK